MQIQSAIFKEKVSRTKEFINKLRRLAPGSYLLFMYVIWIAPVLLIQIVYTEGEALWYRTTYKQLNVFILSMLTISVGLQIAQFRFRFWEKTGPWMQYLILTFSYLVCSALIYWIIGTYHIYETPESEFPILLLPSVIVYFVLGLAFTVLRYLIKFGRSLRMKR